MKAIDKLVFRETEFRTAKTSACQLLHFKHILNEKSLISFQNGILR